MATKQKMQNVAKKPGLSSVVPVAKKTIAKPGTKVAAAARPAETKPTTAANIATPPAASAPAAAALADKAPRKVPAAASSPVKSGTVKPAKAAAIKPPKEARVKPAKLADAKPPKEAKHKHKLVRDSFTMPREDFELIHLLKERALNFKRPTKKSELLRAGLQVLAALDDDGLRWRLDGLVALSPGRPRKHH